jgi:hypothetical protein
VNTEAARGVVEVITPRQVNVRQTICQVINLITADLESQQPEETTKTQ